MNARPAGSLVENFATATNLFGTVLHVRQATAPLISGGHAASVVDDVERQHVRDIDFDHQPRGAGVTDGVAHGFRSNRFGVFG